METKAGKDWRATIMGSASGNPAKYLALTADATAPADTDTTLTGEITTAGSGLLRKAGTFAHTTGTASYTLTATYTATASDTFPANINKAGTFTDTVANGGGTMVFEDALAAEATLNASGDQVTITQTVNL